MHTRLEIRRHPVIYLPSESLSSPDQVVRYLEGCIRIVWIFILGFFVKHDNMARIPLPDPFRDAGGYNRVVLGRFHYGHLAMGKLFAQLFRHMDTTNPTRVAEMVGYFTFIQGYLVGFDQLTDLRGKRLALDICLFAPIQLTIPLHLSGFRLFGELGTFRRLLLPIVPLLFRFALFGLFRLMQLFFIDQSGFQ
jgi:hypothetical protein